MRSLLSLLAVTVCLAVPTANAKEFRPGDILLCGARQCRVVEDAAPLFGSFLYGPGRVTPAPTPPIGSPIFQVRFRNGPAGVIVNATSARVHGLNCGRFRRGRWYRLPRRLRGLATGLEPKRLRAYIPPSC